MLHSPDIIYLSLASLTQRTRKFSQPTVSHCTGNDDLRPLVDILMVLRYRRSLPVQQQRCRLIYLVVPIRVIRPAVHQEWTRIATKTQSAQ